MMNIDKFLLRQGSTQASQAESVDSTLLLAVSSRSHSENSGPFLKGKIYMAYINIYLLDIFLHLFHYKLVFLSIKIGGLFFVACVVRFGFFFSLTSMALACSTTHLCCRIASE